LIDVKGPEKYHIRHLSANQNGSFTDLGEEVKGKDSKFVGADAVVLGDSHPFYEDEVTSNATAKMLKEMRPRFVLFHDVMDAHAISHHHENDIVTKAIKAEHGENSLQEEVARTVDYINWHLSFCPDAKGIIVKSNHDEHLDRYIREGRFVNDPKNIRLASEMIPYMLEGDGGLESAIKVMYGRVPNVKFLTRNDDFKVRGWQLANHGDKGLNGARGSTRGLEKIMVKGIAGHSHTPELFRDIMKVGISAKLNMEYNEGASSWMHANALIYPNGQAQLVNIIDGDWK